MGPMGIVATTPIQFASAVHKSAFLLLPPHADPFTRPGPTPNFLIFPSPGVQPGLPSKQALSSSGRDWRHPEDETTPALTQQGIPN